MYFVGFFVCFVHWPSSFFNTIHTVLFHPDKNTMNFFARVRPVAGE